jgi:hypothetical protein
MASKRMLKDWTASEKMDKLTPEAEVFFVRLIMKADDFGNYTANIKLIRSALFPLKEYNDYQITEWLYECQAAGLLFGYQAEGRRFIHINNFDQKLRRMHAAYPPPPDGQVRTSDGQVNPPDGQVTDKRPPEEKRSRIEEEEENEKTREWFNSCLDDMFKETLQMTHKGKSIEQAAAEAWVYLSADKNRLRAADASDVKKLVNTWMGNMKTGKVKSFNLSDI